MASNIIILSLLICFLFLLIPSVFVTSNAINCPAAVSSFNMKDFFGSKNEQLSCIPNVTATSVAVSPGDIDPLQFALNLEHTEAAFFLFGALGYGTDNIDPTLAMGGPPPIGAMKANLDNITQRIIEEFGYQEVGHLRAIISTVGGFPRPLIDLSQKNFATLMDKAFGYPLNPPFNPYADSLSYLIASYVIPYLGINGYAGANANIQGHPRVRYKKAGLLAVESAQDAVIRALLYLRKDEIVQPYSITVADFTIKISGLRNDLGMCGIKDESLVVPRQLGADMRTCSNIISADANSLAYTRTPAEILRILYLSKDEHVPGGFFPNGGNGRVARTFLS